jgi:cob(I)alamin adenosyltransferase
VSATEKAIGVVKNVLLLRETLERIQKDMEDLQGDVSTLARDVVDIDKRVVRLETLVEVAAARRGPDVPRIKG